MQQLQADKLLEKGKAWLMAYGVPFFSALITGCIAHGFALTNKLVNHDEAGALFIKGATVDSGRWGLALTPLIFPDFSMPWIYGLISIVLVAFAVCLMVDLFGIRSKVLQLLLGGLFVVYPAFTGTLTYMFTVSSYMLSFLLSVLGPYLLCRSKGWAGRGLAIAAMVVSAGIYQSYIAVSATLFVLHLLRLLLKGDTDSKEILLRGITYVAALGISLGLYWLINQLAVQLSGVEAGIYATSAASTHGLLWRFVQAYGAFALSFVTGMNGLVPTAAGRALHILCMGIVLFFLFLQLRQQKNAGQKLLLVGLVCILPLAMNCMYLIAGSGAIHTLVLYSNACIYVLAAMVLENRLEQEEHTRLQNWLTTAVTGAMALVLVGNVYLANQAHLKMHLQYENQYAMCTSLLTEMRMTPGYTAQTPVLLAGVQYGPEFYRAFDSLSQVTGTGGVNLNSWSIRSYFHYYCGQDLPSPTDAQAQAIYQSPEYAAMPCWPDNGSVKMIDGILVAKLS